MSFAAILAVLHKPLFTVMGGSISFLEALGFATGSLNVWLLARQSIWNWPLGLVNNVFYLAIFASSGLYADSGLQVVYITLSLYGWWVWLFGSTDHKALAVSKTDGQTALRLVGAGVVAMGVMYVILSRFTNSTVPFWDALTTALSLVATYGQCRKQIESWLVWMAVDIVYVPLYVYKHLWLTAILYVGYFALCVVGYFNWRRDVHRALPAPAAEAA